MNWYSNNRNDWKEIIETVARECRRAEVMVEKDTIQSMFLNDAPALTKAGFNIYVNVKEIFTYTISNRTQRASQRCGPRWAF